ncbi:MAG TPA: hypothetical protein VKD71_14490 [Gemmataceae bacterium]|nr:hypothetical protein [Gemmataceae bacterium]
MRPFAVVMLVGHCLSLPARAGLYSPDEQFNFELDADGYAKSIQYSGGFDIFMASYGAVGIRPRNPGDPPNQARAEYQQRVEARLKKGVGTLPPEQLAGLTSDLIRLGRADEALNILQPLARDPRRGGFLAYAHLASAHAARGEWTDARDQQQMAVRFSEFPTSFARLSKPQLTWLKRVERDYYLPFLHHRAEESRDRRPGDLRLREDVDPIFPALSSFKRAEEPLRFVSDDGTYAAGKLTAAERKKLPPDAIAIVQQLLIWHPKDPRLHWLLGELYNADGDVESAAAILDACTFNMGYSNPVVIEHRRVLKSAADVATAARAQEAAKVAADVAREREQQKEEIARQQQADRDYQKRFWWIIAIGVALGLLLVYYQFREVVRRFRRA